MKERNLLNFAGNIISAEIMNIPQEFFVTAITELPDKNFGIGGKTIDVIKSEYKR